MKQLTENTTALFFGTYNPVHVGHMIIAQYILEHTSAKELWFMVTPQNPFKQKQSMLPDRTRLEMVELAIDDHVQYKAIDFEFHLPKPSYTSHTLVKLKEKFPNKNFAIIMGSDNLVNFHKWKNYEYILENYQLIVYPRLGKETDRYNNYEHVHFVDAPYIDISSTLIRNNIVSGKNISYMLPINVWSFIDGSGLYR